MKTHHRLVAGAGALSLVVAASAPAFAQSVGQGSGYRGDVAAFTGDSTTLVRMIQDLHLASGDRIVDIRYSHRDGTPGYDVVMQRHGRFTLVHIAEQNGQVVSIAAASAPDWMLKWNNRAELKWDRRATVPLTQAIRTAEANNANAPAIAAGIATSASNPTSDVHAYNVILDIGGATERVAVDGTTGQIIADPSILSDLS